MELLRGYFFSKKKFIEIIAPSPLGLSPFIEKKEQKVVFKGRSSVTLLIFKGLQRVSELRP